MFNPIEMMQLRQLSKLFKARVSVWMQMKYSGSRTRLSHVVFRTNKKAPVVEFPTQAMIRIMSERGKLHQIVGFENNKESG